MVKLPAEELEWGITLGREGLSGLPHHHKPARSGFAEGWSIYQPYPIVVPVCDQVCGNLFDKTPYAYQKATEWCQQEKEFVRRASFVMMAELAIHDKQAQDEAFTQFFPLIKRYAVDERNIVKEAVNWALRQIGKLNSHLRTLALKCAYEIQDMDSKTSSWVARDALRELQAKETRDELILDQSGHPD